MLELHTTILAGPCCKFELFSDGPNSTKIRRVIYYRLRNPEHVSGLAHWIYEGDVNIDDFISCENDPGARLAGKKDNSVENIKEYCKQYRDEKM